MGVAEEPTWATGQAKGPGPTLSDSPRLSEWAMVWQWVGMGTGPPSAAAPPPDPGQPLGLLTLFLSTLPLASHTPCA